MCQAEMTLTGFHWGMTAESELVAGDTRCLHPGHLASINASAVCSPSMAGSAITASRLAAICGWVRSHKNPARVSAPGRRRPLRPPGPEEVGIGVMDAMALSGKADVAKSDPAPLTTARLVTVLDLNMEGMVAPHLIVPDHREPVMWNR
jgi:hypothetical protein